MNNWELFRYSHRNKGGDKSLKNLSTVNAKTIETGESIVMTGAAAGGTAPYEFGYFYKRSTATEWVSVKNKGYISDTTETLTPLSAAVFDIQIRVRDSTGTVAAKDFSVTVVNSSNSTSNVNETFSFGNPAELTFNKDFLEEV